MAETNETIHGKRVEKVGVIFVHGIGEQKRFEHLEAETRKVVNAIIANYGERRSNVTTTLTTGGCDSFLGVQSCWVSGAVAPLHTLVELSNKVVDIAFHEVWWADINEELTLGKQIRFWAWGLSLAGLATHNDRYLPGALNRMRPPHHHGKLTIRNRIRMGYVSVLFGLSAFSVALINMILKRLDFKPLPLTATIVNYLSAVKLYSQDSRAGGGPMDGPDEPPRAAIRRRMIRAMVDVARAGYSRWYILAHSLGTIVAWNGLMEIQQALPNYLDRECWKELEGNPLRGTTDLDIDVDAMMPSRPLWVEPNEIIKRDVLFEKFKGILTYGSPLERFCALWSAMIPINTVEDPFRSGTEWVNVYDPTDPVGTWLVDFNPAKTPSNGHTTLTPHNFPCRASPLLLYSHICYFKAPKRETDDSKNFLVNRVAHWLVEDDNLAEKLTVANRNSKSFWMPRKDTERATHRKVFLRVVGRFVQAGLAGLLLTWITLLSLDNLILPALKATTAMAISLVKKILVFLSLTAIIPWISKPLHIVQQAIYAALQKISEASSFLADHLHLWNWIARLGVEAVVLWVIMILVVIGACLIYHRRATAERKRLRNRLISDVEPDHRRQHVMPS
jgi:hypothetical protein